MVSIIRIICLSLAMATSISSWALTVEASLDTSQINMGETVELTVSVDEQSFGKEPDFSVLREDFDTLSNRQSSQYSIVNGKITSFTRWVLTLAPKKQGYIAVPPLTYEGKSTNPIKLLVAKQKKLDPNNTEQLIFLDANLDKREGYVQEQFICTVRVYAGVEFFDSSYNSPTVENAVVEQLGERRTYQTSINGRPYNVFEFRYAIFPQKSGLITVSSAELIATVTLSRNRGFGIDPFGGKQLRRVSPELQIKVDPKPDIYPADKPWLPAQSVKIEEIWSPDTTEFKVGEPVTRTLTLQAEGLVPTVLPPMPSESFNGIKVYPEQPNTRSSVGANGIVSNRIESQAIIATKPGSVELPPVEVTWWDVNEHKVKVATLPSRTLNVSGSKAQLQTDNNAALPPPTPESTEALQAIEPIHATVNSTWQWIALVSSLLWLITLVVLIVLLVSKRTKRKPEAQKTAETFTSAAKKAALQSLKEACHKNNAKAARSKLVELFRQHWQDDHIKSITHVMDKAESAPLNSALNDLEASLYRSQETQAPQWNGNFLLTTVEEVLKKPMGENITDPLAPLHPV